MKGHLGILIAITLSVVVATKDESITGESKHLLDESVAPSFREGKFRKLVGFYSQTTVISLRTQTSSAIYTCLSTGPAMTCAGRRRRALIKEFDVDSEIMDDDLDGSQDNSALAKISSNRQGRRGVTVWTTHYSTLELIVTEAIPGTTVTVSAICNMINGVAISQSCFVG